MNSIHHAAPMRLVDAVEAKFAIEDKQTALQKAGNYAGQKLAFPVIAVSNAVYALVTGALAVIASPLGMVSNTVKQSVVNPLFKQAEAATSAAMRALTNSFVAVRKQEPQEKSEQLGNRVAFKFPRAAKAAQAVANKATQAISFCRNDKRGKIGVAVASLAVAGTGAYWQRENISNFGKWAASFFSKQCTLAGAEKVLQKQFAFLPSGNEYAKFCLNAPNNPCKLEMY